METSLVAKSVLVSFCCKIHDHKLMSLRKHPLSISQFLYQIFYISQFHISEVQTSSSRSQVQFSSVAQSCPTLCDSIDCSTLGFPVHHQLQQLTQTHVHRVSNAIQPSQPLSSPSPPTFNLSQHQGLFKWVGYSHQGAKVLEFQLQHQSFQWTPRTDLL